MGPAWKKSNGSRPERRTKRFAPYAAGNAPSGADIDESAWDFEGGIGERLGRRQYRRQKSPDFDQAPPSLHLGQAAKPVSRGIDFAAYSDSSRDCVPVLRVSFSDTVTWESIPHPYRDVESLF